MIGLRFGRLLVVASAPRMNRVSRWGCICDCGTACVCYSGNLKSGRTVSCGCYRLEQVKAASTTHGLSRTREHRIWTGIKTRCLNAKCRAYPNYGGRGITICDRWRESFSAFLADMGASTQGTSIDRIDNDRGYEPGNCRWASASDQAHNSRQAVHLTAWGETKALAEWSRDRRCGCTKSTLGRRVRLGVSPELAISRVWGSR